MVDAMVGRQSVGLVCTTPLASPYDAFGLSNVPTRLVHSDLKNSVLPALRVGSNKDSTKAGACGYHLLIGQMLKSSRLGRSFFLSRSIFPWVGLALSLAGALSTWFFIQRTEEQRIHDRLSLIHI